MRIDLKEETLERLESVVGRPIHSRIDRAINEALDRIEERRKK
jgi:hypothetical protein